MKHRLAPCILSLIFIALSIGSAAAVPPKEESGPFSVVVVPAAPGKEGQTGRVDVAVTNTGKEAVRVSRWELPAGNRDADLFEVSRNGVPVAYLGRIVEHGPIPEKDYVVIEAGGTWRDSVDLSRAYDLLEGGEYAVAFRSPLHFARRPSGEKARQSNGLPMVLRSAPARVEVDAAAVLGKDMAEEAAASPPQPSEVVGGVRYTSCSATQIQTAGQAVAAARNYSQDAVDYLGANVPGLRYTRWFGLYTSSRYNFVTGNYQRIDSKLDQNNGQFGINCSCDSVSVYAYVSPQDPDYNIYVCSLFWPQPLTGVDSKAGILVHEMSHFSSVAATQDYAYGTVAATALALANPNNAVRNADNYEYFAENPLLP